MQDHIVLQSNPLWELPWILHKAPGYHSFLLAVAWNISKLLYKIQKKCKLSQPARLLPSCFQNTKLCQRCLCVFCYLINVWMCSKRRIVAAALRCYRSLASIGHQEEIWAAFKFIVKMSATETGRISLWSREHIFISGGEGLGGGLIKAIVTGEKYRHLEFPFFGYRPWALKSSSVPGQI